LGKAALCVLYVNAFLLLLRFHGLPNSNNGYPVLTLANFEICVCKIRGIVGYWLSTALAQKVMQSLPSVCFHSNFEPSDLWPWPFACMGHNHSCHGTEGEHQRSRLVYTSRAYAMMPVRLC